MKSLASPVVQPALPSVLAALVLGVAGAGGYVPTVNITITTVERPLPYCTDCTDCATAKRRHARPPAP